MRRNASGDLSRPRIYGAADSDHGAADEIALILYALTERGIDASALALQRVHTSFVFLDKGLRQFIETGFGVDVVERFSLSEVFGGATFDRPLNAFLLDPYVVGEIVDESGRDVSVGIAGELVLTELFPLVQMQPLIRYRTGDIVERVDAGDNNVAFRWWGRRVNCVAAGVGEARRWLFGFRHLADVLADEPSAARHLVREHATAVRVSDLGQPAFDVRVSGPADEQVVELTVRLRHPPLLYPHASEALTASLWAVMGQMAMGASVRIRVSLEHAGVQHALPERSLSAAPPPIRLAVVAQR